MPPTIKKVSPPSVNGPLVVQNVTAASPLSAARPVTRLGRQLINMVLYGTNRVGKTTLACLFPKPLLLLSFEPGETGGAASVAKVRGVTFLRVNSKADAINVARHLRLNNLSNWKATDGGWQEVVDQDGDPAFAGDPFATHVLDTATSLQNNVLMRELMNLEAAPVQLDWGKVPQEVYRERSEQAKEVMQLYRDLPVNTIFVAQERDHNKSDEDKRRLKQGLHSGSFFAADLGAATVKWMHDACDFICQLYLAKEVRESVNRIEIGGSVTETVEQVETGRSVRRLRCILDENNAAGFRSCDPEVVPEYIEAFTPQEMYADLMRVINGEKALKGYYPKG